MEPQKPMPPLSTQKKTQVTEIYLDLDDVLADLSRYLLKVLKQKKEFKEIYASLSHYNWWEKHISYEELFSPLSQLDWYTLPLCEYARQIYSLCASHVGIGNVFICTCPTAFDGCLQGKFDWCKKHFSVSIQNFIPIVHKERLAASNRLLIDDKLSNCLAWRKQGGLANVYSRPWSDGNWQILGTSESATEADLHERRLEEMSFARMKSDLEAVMEGRLF